MKHYQLEADFASELLTKVAEINSENLSETDQISMELLAFVLQNKIDEHQFKMYLNPITSESAFHLRLNRIARRTLKSEEDINGQRIAESPPVSSRPLTSALIS